MPRLPDKFSLGALPSLNPGRAIARFPGVRASMSMGAAVGSGVEHLGELAANIGAQQSDQDRALDLIRAEGVHAQNLEAARLALERDPDYASHVDKFHQASAASAVAAAHFIRSPIDREKWLDKAVRENARASYTVGHRANALLGQQKQVEVENALAAKSAQFFKTNDPNQHAALLKDQLGIIAAASDTGLIHPLVAKKLMDKYVGGSVYNGANARILGAPGIPEDTDGLMRDLDPHGELGGDAEGPDQTAPTEEKRTPEETEANRPLDDSRESADEADAAAVEGSGAQ